MIISRPRSLYHFKSTNHRRYKSRKLANPAGPTLHQRLVQYFTQNGNQPKGAPEIARDLGVTRNTVGWIFYVGHPEDFQKVEVPGTRKVKWALKHPKKGGGKDTGEKPQEAQEAR